MILIEFKKYICILKERIDKKMTEYFSYKEAMKYLGFDSYKSLTSLIKQGLPVIQVGKTKKISKTAIDKFMNDHQIVKAD